MTIMDALDKLNDLIDESDPDIDLPNIVHAFQTAERIRLDHPQNDWFQLVGLVHDLGKVNNSSNLKLSSTLKQYYLNLAAEILRLFLLRYR